MQQITDVSDILPRVSDVGRLVPSILNDRLQTTTPEGADLFWARAEQTGIAKRDGLKLLILGETNMLAATKLWSEMFAT